MGGVGDGIKTGAASWTFESESVANQFDSHVSKSVPMYHEGHNLILRMLPHFFGNPTRIVDVGCSTGALLAQIENQFSDFDLSCRGVDPSKEMIQVANKRGLTSTEFVCADFMDDESSSVDIIVSYYTLQFVKPRERQDMVDKIYNSLNWGGAFFLFEKTRGSDARFQDIITNAYFKYKREMGYAPEEIYDKYMSLQGVLEPFSSEGNLGLLKRAGFIDIEVIFKYTPFEGVLAIK